jgi:putative sigma-54 modulation protein
MRYSFTGKNVDVTENFQNKITAKLDRISRLIPDEAEAAIKLDDIKESKSEESKKVEVTVKLPTGRILKAEVLSNDLMVAMDDVVDILEGQMVKYKNRLKDKSQKSAKFAEELDMVALDDDEYGSDEIKIVKNKRFNAKPMDAEEAVMQMEMLGFNFFVFRNAQTDEIDVVYKRNDGHYGLIEPED